jgi:hypothetical protein
MEDNQQETPTAAPVLFDRSKSLTLNLRRAGKTVIVRFPSDEELAKRERRMRTFYKKGSSLPEFDGLEEANLELAQSIRTGGDEVDEASAGHIVDIVLKAVPDQPERGPDGYQIKLSVVGNIQTAHTLREPTEKQLRKYRESAMWMGDLRFGRQEARTMLSAVGNFYDSLLVKVEGYAGPVPVTHKSVALNALLTQIKEEQDQDEVDPAGF